MARLENAKLAGVTPAGRSRGPGRSRYFVLLCAIMPQF